MVGIALRETDEAVAQARAGREQAGRRAGGRADTGLTLNAPLGRSSSTATTPLRARQAATVAPSCATSTAGVESTAPRPSPSEPGGSTPVSEPLVMRAAAPVE